MSASASPAGLRPGLPDRARCSLPVPAPPASTGLLSTPFILANAHTCSPTSARPSPSPDGYQAWAPPQHQQNAGSAHPHGPDGSIPSFISNATDEDHDDIPAARIDPSIAGHSRLFPHLECQSMFTALAWPWDPEPPPRSDVSHGLDLQDLALSPGELRPSLAMDGFPSPPPLWSTPLPRIAGDGADPRSLHAAPIDPQIWALMGPANAEDDEDPRPAWRLADSTLAPPSHSASLAPAGTPPLAASSAPPSTSSVGSDGPQVTPARRGRADAPDLQKTPGVLAHRSPLTVATGSTPESTPQGEGSIQSHVSTRTTDKSVAASSMASAMSLLGEPVMPEPFRGEGTIRKPVVRKRKSEAASATTPWVGYTGQSYVCLVKECGKTFKRSEHVKRHVRSVHMQLKRKLPLRRPSRDNAAVLTSAVCSSVRQHTVACTQAADATSVATIT